MKQRSFLARAVVLITVLGAAACEPSPTTPNPGPSGTGGRGTGGRSGTGGSGSGGNTGSGGSASGGNTGSGGAVIDGGTDADGGGDVADGGEVGFADAAGPNLFEDPLAALPVNLKDVGVFPAFPDTTTVHPKAFYFEPRFPLYSNLLDKHRVMVLPEGKKVDTTNRAEWQFPVGTLFFKTFFDKTNTKRPIETRLIRRLAATGPQKMQWEFSVYEWSEDGKSATLITIREPKPRSVNVGGATPITHSIPSKTNCQECHLANFTPIIGFDELRLNGPLPAQTKTQLTDVVEKGFLSAAPTAPLADVVDADPKRQEILRYMHANCGHCHNGGMDTAESITRVFDLRAPKFLANTINQPTTGRTKTGTRIVPGKPDTSILFEAFARESNAIELNRMPRVGVDVADKDAVAKLRAWIMSLPANFVAPQ